MIKQNRIIYVMYLLFTLIFLYSCQDSTVVQFESTDTDADTALVVQLFPGKSHSGVLYYWDCTPPTQGNIIEEPNMAWFNISNGTISLTNSKKIQPVVFEFEAPYAINNYRALTKDANGHWGQYQIILKVTDNPTDNVTSQFLNINLGDSAIFDENEVYEGLNTSSWNASCIPNPYFPSDSMKIKFELSDNLGFARISPIEVYIQKNMSVAIHKVIKPTTQGNYVFFEILHKQWNSRPFYKKWIINVN